MSGIGDESFASRMSVVNNSNGDVTGDTTGALDEHLDLDGHEPSFFFPLPEEAEEEFAQAYNERENMNGTLLNGHAYEEEERRNMSPRESFRHKQLPPPPPSPSQPWLSRRNTNLFRCLDMEYHIRPSLDRSSKTRYKVLWIHHIRVYPRCAIHRQ